MLNEAEFYQRLDGPGKLIEGTENDQSNCIGFAYSLLGLQKRDIYTFPPTLEKLYSMGLIEDETHQPNALAVLITPEDTMVKHIAVVLSADVIRQRDGAGINGRLVRELNMVEFNQMYGSSPIIPLVKIDITK